jgi:sugar phosphate isomerase/epimerase
METSRRNALKLGLGAAALWTTGLRLPGAIAAGAKKIPIGLQLYSVRADCAKDLPGVLSAVGKMGYQGVEFAGYYGRDAATLRKLLDDNGLKCCGTHIGLKTLEGEALKQTVAFNRTLGNKNLIVPSLPKDKTTSRQALVDTAKLFTELAAKVKDEGMRVGYHAHGGDFQKFDGETHWDIFFGNAGPEVAMQLDIGNCLDGGGDPIAILKKFPGRALSIHVKEHGGKKGAAIGEGEVDWKTIFELCETIGGTEWYIAEQESYAMPPLECVAQCLKNLRKMGK